MGLAVGDTTDAIATPLAVLAAEPITGVIAEIRRLAEQYEVVGIVVGLPLNMDGTEGPQAKTARHLAHQLSEAIQLDVRLWDERLSSFEADEALAGKLTRKKKKARQDAVAAGVILRDFLSHDGPQSALSVDGTGT
jgi:putative Holliday junction resolvase